MKLLLHLVQPKYFIPIHGELRHLKQHAVIAQQVGIPAERISVIENGQVVEFQNGKMAISERIPGRYVFVDGSGVGDIGPSVVREREVLARDGFVHVHLTLNGKNCGLIGEPEVITKGFIYTREENELLEDINSLIKKSINCSSVKMQKDLEQALKSFLYSKTKRRPMVFVTISQL
jgi:ribonuclease J